MIRTGALLTGKLTLSARMLMTALGLILIVSAPGQVKAAEPHKGGTLVVATTADTPDLDIQKYLNSSQHNALLPLFDGLVEKDYAVDADFPPIMPGLATSWSVSDD